MPPKQRLDDNHPALAALQALQSELGRVQLKHFTQNQPVQWHALNVAYEGLKLAWYAAQSGYGNPEALEEELAAYKRVAESE